MPSIATTITAPDDDNSHSLSEPKMENKSNPDVSSVISLKRKRPPKIEIPSVLQEIQKDKLKFKDLTSPPQDDAVYFSGIGVAVSSVKGKKKFMEDTHKIVSCLHGNSNKSFFGVYDGHGGKMAAEFVAENLHANIFEMMKNCSGDKEEAIKAGYLKTDEEFLKQGLVSGACCVTAIIEGEDVVVSNLGDCRAVLCRGGVAETLTTDHKAGREDERQRIENKGGYVEFHRGAWRVHGILSVSRSIGNVHLKNWVLAVPDTKILDFTSDMEFLVLASDGLWDEVGNQEAVDIVKRLLAGKSMGPLGDFSKDNDKDYGCVNVSPSSKIRRVSLVKQPKDTSLSPRCKNTFSEDEIAREVVSPPSKTRRISMIKRINVKSESTSQENSGFKRSPASAGLMAACKELTNLAVSRGSLDDITVMIIDLNHFRNNS